MTKDRNMIPDKGYAVVVMGMHRSGTSALAGVLARLGCDAPKDLMPALPQNPKGFYESLSISSFNDTVLSSAGFTWYTWQEFHKAWFRSPKAAEMMDRVGTLLDDVYGSSHLVVLKDPRTSLLVPFWHKALCNNGYAPRYLHIHRHPVDVAKSIETWAAVSKERLPGYSPHYGQLIWLRYALEAEAASRSQSRHFTSYAHLMKDWHDVARRASDALDITWPSLSYHVEDSVAAFLDKSLDHAGQPAEALPADLTMTPWVATTFEILERWANAGEDPKDHETLDAVLADFNRAVPDFSPLIESNRKAAFHLGARLENEIVRGQSEVADANRKLTEARDEVAAQKLAIRDQRIIRVRDDQVKRDQLAGAIRAAREQADESAAIAVAKYKDLLQQHEIALQRQRDAEGHVQALLQSASWRLTGPLRAIVTMLRGSRG